MPDEDRSYHDMTAEELYAGFLNALAGLEDDASIEGYSREGLDQLRAALTTFQEEFSGRYGSGAG